LQIAELSVHVESLEQPVTLLLLQSRVLLPEALQLPLHLWERVRLRLGLQRGVRGWEVSVLRLGCLTILVGLWGLSWWVLLLYLWSWWNKGLLWI